MQPRTTTVTITIELGPRERAIVERRVEEMQRFLESEFAPGQQRQEWTVEKELIGMLLAAIYTTAK